MSKVMTIRLDDQYIEAITYIKKKLKNDNYTDLSDSAVLRTALYFYYCTLKDEKRVT